MNENADWIDCTLGDWTVQSWWSDEGTDCYLCLKAKRNIAEDVLLSLNKTSPWHFGKKLSWLLRGHHLPGD